MRPDDFKRLVAAGLSTDQIAIVMEMMDRDARLHADAEEARKAKGRDRVAKWREARNVTEMQPKVTVPLTGGDARGLDITSSQRIEPQESKGKSAQKRATRLPADWSLPQPWRADAIDLGLPEALIDFEAAKMRDWSLSSKNGAKLNWHATWRNWCRDWAGKQPRGSPALIKQKPEKLANGFSRVLNDMRQERAIRSGESGTSVPALIPNLSVIPGGR